ncbi:MAG TPA: glycosyltransferase [Herpetosiphonaceae bacterium]|nr:glycosyltransferase [Herpetosiphonaceae bacterium]
MTSLPSVSVIVPHFNALDDLDACLGSLQGQDYPPERVEIIVCDNGSPIAEAELTSRIAGRAKLVFESQKGAGPARNRAVSHATGDVLAFVDSDCIAQPGWLSKGVEALARGDLVGGGVRVFARSASPTGAEVFEEIFAFNQRRYVEELGFSVTANLFCHRDVFEKVGPFLNGVSEDVEWCRRATMHGYKIVFARDALVAHPSRPDWPSLRQKWQRLLIEQFALVMQTGRVAGRAWWIVRQFAVAASVVPHSAKVLAATQFTWRQRARALGTLVRIRLWRAAYGLKMGLLGLHQSQD